eukprot:1900940-Amphidinium_carterae.4
MHEAELITARERDQYYEQLLASVPQTQPQSAHASPPPPVQPQVIPPQMQPAAASAATAAASTPGTQQQPPGYPPAGQSYVIDPATGLATPVVTTPAEVPLPIHYASSTPAMGSGPGTVPWRPLGQAPGFNPLTGMYGTDPPTPAMQPSVVTPQGVPSQYSIVTPPVPQGLGCGGAAARSPNPIDPLQIHDSWADYLSSRRSLGPQTSAPSIGGSPPGYPHGGGPPGPGTPAPGHTPHEEFEARSKLQLRNCPA